MNDKFISNHNDELIATFQQTKLLMVTFNLTYPSRKRCLNITTIRRQNDIGRIALMMHEVKVVTTPMMTTAST